MTTHELKLRQRDDVAEGTMAFHFDKPPGFAYRPGQAIDLVLPETRPGMRKPFDTHSRS